MHTILTGKPVITALQESITTYLQDNTLGYLSVIVCGEDHISMPYVRHKQKFGASVGIDVVVQFSSVDEISWCITDANNDPYCSGIIVQLPLPGCSEEEKHAILSLIDPAKDPDALSLNPWLLGATPAAALAVVDHYGYEDMTDKIVAVLGQSDLVGKPLAQACRVRGAKVAVFDITSDPAMTRTVCSQADYIFAATWSLHLVDETFVGKNPACVLVDIGRGMKEGMPAGDMNFDRIVASAPQAFAAYTPVPGWVGPVTVASIFTNMVKLAQIQETMDAE
jgi:methylenetetrahydrofolate dehydrogenase (NADP+) / methenyltetrahydrofolate cyclohydrolase